LSVHQDLLSGMIPFWGMQICILMTP